MSLHVHSSVQSYCARLSRRVLALCFIFIIAGFPARTAYSQTVEERGLAIATEADRRDTGFGDYLAELVMILRNRHGQESTRQMRFRALEMKSDGDRSLVVFDRPDDVKGTVLLSFTHKRGPDDQWLFLPALKRVKRIASENKSGPFVGSEFAYEDLTSQEVEKYLYKYLRDETYSGQDCYVIERYPVDPKSGYTRQVVWFDKAEYRPMKIDYFDRKNAPLKMLTFHGYRKYVGRYWRADELHMVNHQTGKSTRLVFNNYRFRTGLTERDFDRSSLEQAR